MLITESIQGMVEKPERHILGTWTLRLGQIGATINIIDSKAILRVDTGAIYGDYTLWALLKSLHRIHVAVGVRDVLTVWKLPSMDLKFVTLPPSVRGVNSP